MASMRQILLTAAFFTMLQLPAQQVIRLYNGKAPGSENWNWTEKENSRNGFNTHLVYNVSDPSITAYLPPAGTANGTAVIVAPGGAFHILSIDNEGVDVAKWLNAHGIAAFVLKYRVVKSATDDPVKELLPLMGDMKKLDAINAPVVLMATQDGLAAVKYVRQHAADFNLAPDRIGFMGFSAGGTLTMNIVYHAGDESRPNFVAPIYAYGGAITDSPVPSAATPIFIVAASDDQLGFAPHSLDIYLKWLAAKQPAELHVYEKGGHGFGMAPHHITTDTWIERFGDWLQQAGFMPGAATAAKPRTIVTTDGEIDDVDSYIRMLLYANEFSLEGLIYSSSMWHYKGDGKGTPFISAMDMTKKMYGEKTSLRWPGNQWMNGLLDAYGKVYPLLSTHAQGYPSAEYLKSVVKTGNIDFEGDMDSATEGSNFIKEKLLDNNTAPLYLQVWGGTNTIARALKSIEEEYGQTPQWPVVYKKVCNKAIIYAILDQDATYKKYIAPAWPGIKVYYNANQFWCLAYPWKQAMHPSLYPLLEGKFMGDKIIKNHGPLTAMYYSYGDGQKQEGDDEHVHGDITKIDSLQWGHFKQYDFISEGDSPAFLHLVNTGLGNLKNPQYGGWGGRLKQSAVNPNRWEDGESTADYNPLTKKMDMAYPQTRWLAALQNDFAARADWCVKKYAEANHPPVIKVVANTMPVSAGKTVTLSAMATDPDKNLVKLHFWQYREAGTSPEKLLIAGNANEAIVQVPAAARKGDSFHVIVEGTDNGTPALTRYQRIVLTVQ
jgi:acetyl esterase/lipase